MSMRFASWHRLLVPLTIAAMLLLFTEKAANLARAATGAAEVPTPAFAAESPTCPVKPANGVSAPSPVAEASPVPAADLALLADLKARSDALDRRSKELDQRGELQSAVELKLRLKLNELTALQGHLEDDEKARQQRQSANWESLVKIYEDMKPNDAAAIFNVVDTDVLIEVLDRMEERKAALVLEDMLPERARQATQILARRRLQEGNPAPLQPQESPPLENHS